VIFELRIVVVALAAFAGVGLAVAAIVPAIARRRSVAEPARRARRLAALRLLPSIAAVTVSAVVTASFVFFEHRLDGEQYGVAMPLLALLGGVLLATTVWRAYRLTRSTRHVVAEWLRSAEPVALPGATIPAFAVPASFPIVAVIGLSRPRLIIARSVLASCSEDELRAVLAHEQGHIDRRDNLRRLLLAIAPDVLSWLPASSRMFAAWRQAAEEAADDDAANAGRHGRVALASALVKVARLAPAGACPPPMPASALYRGEDLERRVRRLLEPGGPNTARPFPTWVARAMAAGALTVSIVMLEGIHGFVETLIHTLP
jgi:Zn-dependent protease with chaperone function